MNRFRICINITKYIAFDVTLKITQDGHYVIMNSSVWYNLYAIYWKPTYFDFRLYGQVHYTVFHIDGTLVSRNCGLLVSGHLQVLIGIWGIMQCCGFSPRARYLVGRRPRHTCCFHHWGTQWRREFLGCQLLYLWYL